MSMNEETFNFSELPWVIQRRFIEIANVKTTLDIARCNRFASNLVHRVSKNTKKRIMYLPDEYFDRFPIHSKLAVSEADYGGNEDGENLEECKTLYSIKLTHFTVPLSLRIVYKLPAHIHDIDVSVSHSDAKALIELVNLKIRNFNFRGKVWFVQLCKYLNELLQCLSKMAHVDVRLESCLEYEDDRRHVLIYSQKYPKLSITFHSSDVRISTI